jgi:hypothetical protein
MFEEHSLRYALVALCPGYFWCAWHLWQGSKTADDDAAVAQVEDELLAAAAVKR